METNYLKYLPIIFSVLALLISIIVAIRNWRYNEIAIRQNLRNQYMSNLFDIDKLLISNPKLWAIYDNHSTGIIKSDDPEEKGRRLAMLYYLFNLFECMFVSYTHVLRLNKYDKIYWESWKNYMRQLFENSSEACAIFKQPASQEIFSQDYVTFVNSIILDIEKNENVS